MAFLPQLGRKAPVVEAARHTPTIRPSVAGKPYRDGWDSDRAFRDGMQRVTWVFSAIDAIASAQTRLPIRVRSGDPLDGEFIADHPVSRILNGYPNPFEPAAVFRWRVSAQILLSRQGCFIEVIRSNAGEVLALYLLPPQYTAPIPDARTFISGYRMHIPGSDPVNLSPSDVIWIRKPHPFDPYSGITPIEAAGIAIDMDFAAKLYNRRFLQNDGRPGGLLNVQGDLDDDEAEYLRGRFSGGPESAGRIGILNAEDVSFVDTAISPRDAQYIEGRKQAKDEILVAFGVSESQIGNAADRTFANADAEDEIFWEKTMFNKHLPLIATGLDQLDGDPNTFVVFDPSSVGVLGRHERERQTFELEEIRTGVRAPSEYREGNNFAAVDDPSLDNFYVPQTWVPIGAITPTAEPIAAQTPMVPAKSLKRAATEPSEPDPRTEMKARRRASLSRDEALLNREAKRLFARMEKVVLAKLGSAKRLGPKPELFTSIAYGDWAAKLKKQADPARIFDVDYWRDQIKEGFTPVLEDIYTRWGEEAMAGRAPKVLAGHVEVKQNLGFDVHDPAVTRRIETQVNRLVAVADTTYDDIKAAIAEAEAEGEGIVGIAEAIKGVFADASEIRAETIARTEVLSAANGGSIEGARQDGVFDYKEWLATDDDRTRPDHVEADGQRVPVDEPFDVGGESLDYPGDPAGAPENVINCRCTLIYGSG